jgi:hypothetical protein
MVKPEAVAKYSPLGPLRVLTPEGRVSLLLAVLVADIAELAAGAAGEAVEPVVLVVELLVVLVVLVVEESLDLAVSDDLAGAALPLWDLVASLAKTGPATSKAITNMANNFLIGMLRRKRIKG